MYKSSLSPFSFFSFLQILLALLTIVSIHLNAIELSGSTAHTLLIEPIAHDLKDTLENNPKMTIEEKKDFVLNQIDTIDHNEKCQKILSAFKKEIKDSMHITEQMNQCILKANETSQAQACFKELDDSFNFIGRTFPLTYPQNLVWNEKYKQSLLTLNNRINDLAKKSLTCFENADTVSSALKCNPENKPNTTFDSTVSLIIMLANTYKVNEEADKLFNEKCQQAKSTIFEYPSKNKGVFFDTPYSLHESYKNIDKSGKYVKTYRKINIDEMKLFDLVGFIERNSDKFHKEYLYFDKENRAGNYIKEPKSRYKIHVDRLEHNNKYAYAVSGHSINLIDTQNNKIIANSIYFDNGYNHKICGDTYEGSFDVEYFVYHVFSQSK